MGFAAEIKEFLSSAKDSWKQMSDSELKSAQAKYQNTLAAKTQADLDNPLNDEEQKAKIANLNARTANAGKSSSTTQQLLDYLKAQAAKPAPVVGAIPDSGNSNAVVAPAPARPDTDAAPAPLMKKGGLVRKFAEGGMIEDDDLEDDELPAQAIPTSGQGLPGYTNKPGMLTPTAQPARPAAPAVPAVPRTMGGMPIPQPRPASAPPVTPEQQAVADGLKYFAGQISQAPAVGSSRKSLINAMAQGAGAAPTNEMVQIYKKIDPTGKKYSEGERNLRALQALHTFKLNSGDPEGAAKASFQMLQHFNTAQTRYGALAQAAMANGHVDEGVKLALKQYANIPDGNNLDMWVDKKTKRIGWELTTDELGEDGKPKKISGGVATPEEIGSAAAGLAAPGGFQNHLAQMISGAKIAGGPGAATGAPAGGRGAKAKDPDQTPDAPTPGTYKELKQEDVDTWLDKWNEAKAKTPEGKAGKALTPDELTSAKNMLYHIRRSNDVTNDQALQRVQTILGAPDPKKGETPAFTVAEDKEAKTRTFEFPDGGELVVPNNQYGMFRTARLEAQEQRKKAAADAIEAAKPGMAGKARDLLLSDPEGPGQAAAAVGKALVGPGGLGGVYEGAKTAGKAVGGAVADFGREAVSGLAQTHPGLANALRNPNVDTTNPDDRPL